MSNILPANRVAAIAAFLTGLAGAVLAITNTFPKNWQQTAIAIAGILGAIGTALHFMLGSQKMDQHASDQAVARMQLETAAAYNQSVAPQAPVAPPFDHEADQNVTDVTDVTGGLDIDPNYNPGNALNPEPDAEDAQSESVDASVVTPPAE